MTRLYFARHGATQLTAEDRFSGATGVDLSDEGRAQVQRLAERLAGDKIVAIYVSPLGRTVETAQILRGMETGHEPEAGLGRTEPNRHPEQHEGQAADDLHPPRAGAPSHDRHLQKRLRQRGAASPPRG